MVIWCLFEQALPEAALVILVSASVPSQRHWSSSGRSMSTACIDDQVSLTLNSQQNSFTHSAALCSLVDPPGPCLERDNVDTSSPCSPTSKTPAALSSLRFPDFAPTRTAPAPTLRPTHWPLTFSRALAHCCPRPEEPAQSQHTEYYWNISRPLFTACIVKLPPCIGFERPLACRHRCILRTRIVKKTQFFYVY